MKKIESNLKSREQIEVDEQKSEWSSGSDYEVVNLQSDSKKQKYKGTQKSGCSLCRITLCSSEMFGRCPTHRIWYTCLLSVKSHLGHFSPRMLIDPVDVGPIQYIWYAIVSYFHAPFDRVHLSATLNCFSFSTSEIRYWCTDRLISPGHFFFKQRHNAHCIHEMFNTKYHISRKI